ncbi:MAG: molybdenum ABC transporter ATP-binding protein [Bacteroidetes bacterium HGW-Bacteroidetes-21]|jgi:ABC-type sugar transport system ATPase subunit|nr:MAG: molybdenum ABC transporter ATP-binding protein [Bacteroidetes bacterium HGW-Bacteroidetes-21]
MLAIKNLEVKAGSFSLKDISFTINKGSYHVLIGPSGSGKTLLLNTIAGFQKIKNGEIVFEGHQIQNSPPEKRGISYLFQDLALFPHLSVFNNIAYPLRNKKLSREDLVKKVEEYLEFTEIKSLANRSIKKLSGGERQRVALSRILITGAPVVMLDEPFSAIDSQLKPSLKALLKKISAQGISILHVTHDFNEIKNLADTVTVIKNGSILVSGCVSEVLTKTDDEFVKSFINKDIE